MLFLSDLADKRIEGLVVCRGGKFEVRGDVLLDNDGEGVLRCPFHDKLANLPQLGVLMEECIDEFVLNGAVSSIIDATLR